MSKCEGKSWDRTISRFFSCQNTGKIERDGKFYCGIHDPVKVKEREAKTNARVRSQVDAIFESSRKKQEQAQPFAGLEAENERLISELSQSRAENALLVEKLDRAEKVTRMGPFCVVCAMKREQPHKPDCPFFALTTLPDQVKELSRDAELGRMVREIPKSHTLCSLQDGQWCVATGEDNGQVVGGFHSTPQAALAAAMKSDQGREVG